MQTIPVENGCDSTVNLQLAYYSVYIPTIFSPNGDGKNDIFTLFGGTDLQAVIALQIFDRWGNLMFEGKELSPNKGWIGDRNGEPAAQGVYLYQAKILMDDEQERAIAGTVALIR